MTLTHLSLFSGIGGLDLAAEWAGFQSVGQCEWADYPTKVLEKHWPDVPRWRDIKTLTGDDFYERTGLRTVDVISGGFPCQPFSVAGKRRGKEDDRFLWPEMVRVIQELRPAWVVGENVAGIVNLALDDVLSDLEAQGYQTRTFLFPAHAVGAPHRRYRTAIVAHRESERERRLPIQPRGSREACTNIERSRQTIQHPDGAGCEKLHAAKEPVNKRLRCGGRNEGIIRNTTGKRFSDRSSQQVGGSGTQEPQPKRPDCNVSDSNTRKPMRRETRTRVRGEIKAEAENNGRGMPEYAGREWWSTEPGVGRVAHGVPNRVDRLKCLGNAVVRQQFYPVFKYMAEIERALKHKEDTP